MANVLPEDERQRIKDEVFQDIRKSLPLVVLNQERKTHWIIAAVSSPLTIALVSGLGINVLATRWQNKAAKIQRDEARRIELRDRRQRVFVEFADSFCQTVSRATSYKSREAWLRQTQKIEEAKRGKYRDGRDYDATVRETEALKAEFLKTRMPDSLCNQILVSFNSQDVLTNAETLRTKCDRIVESFDPEEISRLQDDINVGYKTLIQQMAAELRKENE